jgi:hypothetical protein
MPKKLEDRIKYVKARVYDTTKPDFVFPEDTYKDISNRENFGITFSGGGSRAVSMAMGQLRALNKIGVLDRAKYLSAISGGSWASMPFIFLDEELRDDVFWGPYLKPDQINSQNLDYAPDYSLTKAIQNATFLDKIFSELDFGHDLYAQIVAKIILHPFKAGNQKKFFTLNTDSLEQILKINPFLKAEDFYLVNKSKNRPFYIVGGALLRPNYTRYLFEMTPLYVGVNAYFPKNKSKDRFDIGGGYVEPHGFNTFAPDEIKDDIIYTLLGKTKNMFNLGDMVGTSSAAPALFTNRFGIRWLGFPRFKYWCNFTNPVDTVCSDYDFGDGGILENIGIMPLLKRKVKKIISFVNCETVLTGPDDSLKQITNSISALFYKLHNQYGDKNFDENIVFANQKDKYLELVNDLLAKKSKGLPLIHTNTYRVTKQPHYNITEEYNVEIMWVYNETAFEWHNSLKPEIKKLIKSSPLFKGFPHYKTFMQNSPDALALKPPQVNLLSQLCSWIIDTNQDKIENFLK